MLFQSTVTGTMQQIFKHAQHQGTRARKNEAVKRTDYYQSEQDAYTFDNIAKWMKNPEKLTPLQINIVRKVINNLAMVYFRPAKRNIDGTERDAALFKDIEKTTALNASLKQASKYTKLHKTILLRVVWRKGQLELDLLTPDILDVMTGDSPRDLKQVMVTNYPASGKADEVTYSLWTPDTFNRLDWRGQVVESEPNPYGVLPFVPCWDSLPIDSFWVNGGHDLISAQDAINEKLTDLLYIIRSQGFGIGYLKNTEYGPKGIGEGIMPTVDPGSFVMLPGGQGEIGFVSPNAPIKEVWETIEAIIKQVAVANGLSAHSLTATPSNESGISKIVSNHELMERRQDDIELWRRYEAQLFDLIKSIWNVHNPGKKFSDKASMSTDFAELREPSQELDEASKWQMLIDAGQASAIDWAIARNPDLNREQAKAYLEQIQKESDELAATERQSTKQPIFDFDGET